MLVLLGFRPNCVTHSFIVSFIVKALFVFVVVIL